MASLPEDGELRMAGCTSNPAFIWRIRFTKANFYVDSFASLVKLMRSFVSCQTS